MAALAPAPPTDARRAARQTVEPATTPGRWLGGGWGTHDHPVEHVLYRVWNTPVAEHPFQHMNVCGVFPPDYYREILAHLPAPELYTPLNAEYPLRGSIDLTDPASIGALPSGPREFWAWFVDAFTRPAFMHSVLERYGTALAGRYRDLVRPMMFLFRDAGGYGIGPHTDTDHKVVTQLFYLPEDDSQRAFGTSIMVPKDPSAVHGRTGHESWDDYRSAWTAPFAPNSMLSFVVSDRSFHAVRSTPPGSVRHSLQYFIVQAR